MKAVVLAAGLGTRLRPITPEMPKHLIPVANRPLVGYSFDVCRALGINDVVLVLHPSMDPDDARLATCREGLRLATVYQQKPRGLADAVRAAGPEIGDERFLLLLSDSIVDPAHLAAVQPALLAPGSSVCITPVADPRQYGVAEIREGYVTRLVEKPQAPTSHLALVGVYVLEPDILEAIDTTVPSTRGELEITDTIGAWIDSGHLVRGVELTGGWTDAGNAAGLLAANRTALVGAHLGAPGDAAARVDPKAQVVDSQFIGPLIIGPGAVVTSSRIGPNASIGPGCRIRDSRVTDSILLDRVVLDSVDVERVVVGNDTLISGPAHRSARLRDAVVGHREQIQLAQP